jgi:periplasmic divalent cation tolerance protein
MTEYCMALTTTDSREAAQQLARSAVEVRLAGCAQMVGPVESTYWWQGALETAEEWQVWFKTTDEHYPALERHIGEKHSYDVPEVLRIPVEAGAPSYLLWLREETAAR